MGVTNGGGITLYSINDADGSLTEVDSDVGRIMGANPVPVIVPCHRCLGADGSLTGFSAAGGEMQFASAVASFGMLLRGSEHKGTGSYDAVLEIAESAKGADKHGYRAEFVEMVRRAKALAGR